MKKKVYLLAFLLTSLQAIAQHAPVHSQYFINPFVYNPAYAGFRGYSEVYVSRRMSTQRNDGTYSISSLSMHLPLSKKKVAFGLTIVDHGGGFLSRTSALLSASYHLQFSKDHFLRTGISAGLAKNSADLDKLEGYHDAEVLRLVRKKNYLDANVGVSYQYKAFNLGASFPTLINKQLVNTHYRSEIRFSQLDYYLFNARYELRLSKKAAFTPQVLYRLAVHRSMPSEFEVMGVLNLMDRKKDNRVWVGGSYRQAYGPSVFGGAKISKTVKMGYAYEPFAHRLGDIPHGSHELMLTIRFEQKKIKNQPVNKSAASKEKEREKEKTQAITEPKTEVKKTKAEAAVENKAKAREEKAYLAEQEAKERKEKIAAARAEKAKEAIRLAQPIERDTLLAVDNDNSPVPVRNQTEKTVDVKKPVRSMELPTGNYVVVGSFSIKENALRYSKTLQGQGLNTRCQFSSHTNHYYVYVTSNTDVDAARAQWDLMRQIAGFEFTWVLIVQ